MSDLRTIGTHLLKSDSEEMRDLGDLILKQCDRSDTLYNALLAAVDVIDHWDDCPAKAKQADTIQAIEYVLWPKLVMAPFRDALENTTVCVKGDGACDE